jgi:tetratricopeptide (TPR) repeat protein
MVIGTDSGKRRRIAGRVACMALASWVLATGLPAFAQQDSSASVQALNAALDALARAPTDVSALLRAGWASLNLDDTQAALGFFRRAEQAAPTNGEAKAGEASALVRLHDPVNAVKQFAAAEAAGAPMAAYAGDRGLALDLVGQNVAAQRYYQQALAQKYDPEIVRRLALSQAISGDQRASDATLLPQLQRQDLSAYRTRAFALAILGKGEDAVSIAEKMLPANLSNRMAPYLRYMPRLTRAQQAAAANLGEFPAASEIGHDDPQIAALSAQNPAPQVAQATPDARLVPSGQPLGRSDRSKNDRREKRRDKKSDRNQGRVSVTYAPLPQPAVPQAAQQQPPSPAVTSALAQPSAELPPVPRQASPQPSAELPAAPQQTAPQPVVVARLEQQPTPTPTPAATSTLQQSPAELAAAPQEAAPQPVLVAALEQQPTAPSTTVVDQVARPALSVATPPPAPARVRAATNPVSLADAFADFSREIAPQGPAPGAVDITKIKPTRAIAKPQAKPVAKPKPPPNPSRVWVQVGTGRDVKALEFTWRKLSKEGGSLLSRHDAYWAKWGRTRRLVTGPYKSEDDAQAAIKALKKKGIGSFAFVSDEGEEVTPLE